MKIKLTNTDRCAIIDSEDHKRVSEYEWLLNSNGAVKISRPLIGNKGASMGQFIMHFPYGKHVHHINGNPFDNRKVNLAIVNKTEHSRIHMSGNGLHKRPWGYDLKLVIQLGNNEEVAKQKAKEIKQVVKKIITL